MTSPSVSVIVPLYNVESYVVQCLDSLLVQDLESIEVIMVNDGSTDGTEEIAARYAANPNFSLVNQNNQGLSAARNAGMSKARGRYLGFVDGDDWVHSSMYREMYDLAELTGADLVITNGYLYDDMQKKLQPIQDHRVWAGLRDRAHNLAIAPRREPEMFRLDTSACKRLYRRDYLSRLGCQFLPGKIFEDVAMHYTLLLNSDAVAMLDRKHYYYRTNRPGRITAKKDRTLFQVFDIMNEVIDQLERCNASDVIWANFIWFQNWVLRWLRNQIELVHVREFEQRCFDTSTRFRASAIDLFMSKFANDAKAIAFVQAQISNNWT
ncbi:MAG: glycosyltransferase [Hyphomicrobiaceae bacterium]|nr:glycosyltransferase [Hyphomicrobiaceae bacterium]